MSEPLPPAVPPCPPSESPPRAGRPRRPIRTAVIAAAVTAVAVVAGGAGLAVGRTTAPTEPAGAASAHDPSASGTTMPGMATPNTTGPDTTGRPPTTGPGATGTASTAAGGSTPGDYIGQQAGRALAGNAPLNVTPAQAAAAGNQPPPGATVDPAANRVTFTTPNVSFTVVAVPPGGPDMTFRLAGLVNPEIVVPAGASVKVEFINADPDQAHGWEVTRPQSPPPFRVDGPAIPGALAAPIGDPTAAGDGARTISFQAGAGGSYEYVCVMPGHAQMGMQGLFSVSGS